jgi:hypothetical protein
MSSSLGAFFDGLSTSLSVGFTVSHQVSDMDFFSPTRWVASQSPIGLMVIRLLLIANSVVLAAGGALCFIFVSHPAGIAMGSVAWGVVVVLLLLVPLTNPVRLSRKRW